MPSPDIAAVFAGYPKALRNRLHSLRRLILETAAATDGVGPLEETLKWGQPSYLTADKSGSTIRIGPATGAEDRCALFVHCQTDLIAQFRVHYPDRLQYEGKRAVVLPLDGPLPEAELRHCIALALTYHRRKATRPAPRRKATNSAKTARDSA